MAKTTVIRTTCDLCSKEVPVGQEANHGTSDRPLYFGKTDIGGEEVKVFVYLQLNGKSNDFDICMDCVTEAVQKAT